MTTSPSDTTTDSNPPRLGPIGQVAVNVHDLERAVAFYRDVLGLPLLMEVPGMAFFDCGTVRLMLGLPASEEDDHPSSILYFKTGDIQATHRQLAERDVHFRREPFLVAQMSDHELWMAFFLDSEGNTMALMSEVPS